MTKQTGPTQEDIRKAECWTCTLYSRVTGEYHPIFMDSNASEPCRAAGHDVRPVAEGKVTR